MPATTHFRLRRGLVAVAAAATVLTAAAPATAGSYGWPVRPFDRQHPVRGFFGDPRIAGEDLDHGSFHFGIDVSAPNGTPVYATATGRVVIEAERPDVVSILDEANSRRVLAYWHVVPSVRNGDRAVAYRTVLGRIERPWGHVHFAESIDGRYVNPLRGGAMTPYRDTTRPTIHAFSFDRDGVSVPQPLRGPIDLVVEAWDDTPLAVPAPWADKPVAPALVRWRISGPRSLLSAARWTTAADFRRALPECPYGSLYARWTRQNHPWGGRGRGRYRFLLAHRFDTSSLSNGAHVLEVEASDTRGNTARAHVRFRVTNPR